MSFGQQPEIPPTNQSDKLFFRPGEAAKATGLCRNFIFGAMAEGALLSVKVGRARLIAREDLLKFVNSHREVA